MRWNVPVVAVGLKDGGAGLVVIRSAEKVAGEGATFEWDFDGLARGIAQRGGALECVDFGFERFRQERIDGKTVQPEIGDVVVSRGTEPGFAGADRAAFCFAFCGKFGEAVGGNGCQRHVRGAWEDG